MTQDGDSDGYCRILLHVGATDLWSPETILAKHCLQQMSLLTTAIFCGICLVKGLRKGLAKNENTQ